MTEQQLKIKAHYYFDYLWQWTYSHSPKPRHLSQYQWKNKCRRARYMWLSRQLNIPPQLCHFSLFDTKMCLKAIDICKTDYNYLKRQCQNRMSTQKCLPQFNSRQSVNIAKKVTMPLKLRA